MFDSATLQISSSVTKYNISALCVVFPGNCVRMHRRASFAVVEDFEVKVSCFLGNDDISEEDKCRYKPPEAWEVWVCGCCILFQCIRVCRCVCACTLVHIPVFFCMSVAWW